MKVLKIILLILVVVIGGALIWLSTLNGTYDVNRSVTIHASANDAYAAVSDLATWPKWGVWFEKDSTMVTRYNEQTQGLGAWYTWTGSDGKGRLEIIEVDPGASMKTQIDFEGMGSSYGYWTFEPTEGGTKVTWGMTGEMPFLARYMASKMDQFVGADFEAGLENLKDFVENKTLKKATAGYEFTEMQLNPMDIYYVHHEVSWDEISSALYASSYGAIGNYLAEDAANMTGMPMVIYQEWEKENKTTAMDIAMPCASDKPGNDEVLKGKSYEGTVLKTTYYGAYDAMEPVYNAADAFMMTNGYAQNGPVTEVYITDPGSQPDTTHWATEIYWAVEKK